MTVTALFAILLLLFVAIIIGLIVKSKKGFDSMPRKSISGTVVLSVIPLALGFLIDKFFVFAYDQGWYDVANFMGDNLLYISIGVCLLWIFVGRSIGHASTHSRLPNYLVASALWGVLFLLTIIASNSSNPVDYPKFVTEGIFYYMAPFTASFSKIIEVFKIKISYQHMYIWLFLYSHLLFTIGFFTVSGSNKYYGPQYTNYNQNYPRY